MHIMSENAVAIQLTVPPYGLTINRKQAYNESKLLNRNPLNIHPM